MTNVTDRSIAFTQLDLRTVTGPELPLHLVFAPADLGAAGEEFRVVSDARFDGAIEKKDAERFRLAGRVTVTLEVNCGRCLEPFVLPVDVPVDLTYVPDPLEAKRPAETQRSAVATGAGGKSGDSAAAKGGAHARRGQAEPEPEIELNDEDLTTAYYRNQVIDLAEMLREQFVLALPMRPLCREDCRGLCPQCGTNLNQGTCACETRWEDPRLEGLRSLLKKTPTN